MEERRAAAAVQLLASSSLATTRQGRATEQVRPTITSPPLNASQPGAPCNCVSHQPAIAFKRSGVGNPDWPRPGLCLYEDLETPMFSRLAHCEKYFL